MARRKKADSALQSLVIREKDNLMRRFDELLYKKETDYEEAKSYLKELDSTLKTIRKIVQKLNKKMVSYEKQISALEYDYKLKQTEEERLKRLYREIPKQIRELSRARKENVSKISKLLKSQKLASIDLAKASKLLTALEEGVKKHTVEVNDLSKDLKELKKKRVVLQTADWTKEELLGPRTEISAFLRRETRERKMKERMLRRERASLDRILNSKLKRDLMKLVEETL